MFSIPSAFSFSPQPPPSSFSSSSTQDPDGVIAQREINKSQGGGPQGGHGGMGGMGGMDRMGPGPNGPMINIPPSLMNNPNIPNEIIYGLQAGRIGNTVFVANVRLPKFYHWGSS